MKKVKTRIHPQDKRNPFGLVKLDAVKPCSIKPTKAQLKRWAKMPDWFDNITEEDRERAWKKGIII